jgi:ribosomal protein S18 acetylase RimI-like enzyme
LQKRIEDKPDSIFVAVIDYKIVGCVYLVDDIFSFIFRLAVKKIFRKQGVGKQLLHEAMVRLQAHGHNEIALFVDEENEALKAWYHG